MSTCDGSIPGCLTNEVLNLQYHRSYNSCVTSFPLVRASLSCPAVSQICAFTVPPTFLWLALCLSSISLQVADWIYAEFSTAKGTVRVANSTPILTFSRSFAAMLNTPKEHFIKLYGCDIPEISFLRGCRILREWTFDVARPRNSISNVGMETPHASQLNRFFKVFSHLHDAMSVRQKVCFSNCGVTNLRHSVQFRGMPFLQVGGLPWKTNSQNTGTTWGVAKTPQFNSTPGHSPIQRRKLGWM